MVAFDETRETGLEMSEISTSKKITFPFLAVIELR